jgi:hypothetical protein
VEQDLVSCEAQLKQERTLRCRAQSLVHKLAKVLETADYLPRDVEEGFNKLLEAVKTERAALLLHKRAEVAKDVEAARAKITSITVQIGQIQQLGGHPGPALLEDRQRWAAERDRLVTLTDDEVLG